MAITSVASFNPLTTSADDPLEQPVETMSPEEVALQSTWPGIDLKLAVPQDTDADLAASAQVEVSQFVGTQELGLLEEEGLSDSSWPFPESEETQASGTNSHLSRADNAILVDDPAVPDIPESPTNSSGLPVQETLLAGESVAESQIESGPQPAPDLEGDPVGYSEPDIVEEANPLTFDGEGTAAPAELGEPYIGHFDHESSESGALEHGQPVGLSERHSEAPSISEEWGSEPPTLPQDNLSATFADRESREELPAVQSWQEPSISRPEPEKPADSSAPSEITARRDEPLPAVSPPVVDTSTTAAAAIEPATDPTPAPKDSRVQIAESRKPISTVGLNESAVRTASRPVTATLSRFLFRVALFIRSCFATAHAIAVTLISLTIFAVGCAVLLVGGLGLVWLGLEEKPNSAFQDLVGARPQLTGDPNRNGALYLLGFAAPESKDPIQAGLAIQNERANFGAANGCLSLDDPAASQAGSAATSTLASWYREDVPSGFFRSKGATLKEGFAGRAVSMARYQQWLTLPFDDVGYGQAATPDCRLILDIHRLFVAEGFAQGLDQGIERIETEVAVWRGLLRKVKTLGTKLLAVAAVNDDARVVSGLLTMPELDARYLPRLAKLVSPMDGVEQSLRWPMQHEFLLEKKRIEMALRPDHQPARPWYLAGIALMPLPNQRVLNSYADYYEDLIKSVETARTMPTVASP